MHNRTGAWFRWGYAGRITGCPLAPWRKGEAEQHRTQHHQQKPTNLDEVARNLHLSKTLAGASSPVFQNVTHQSHYEAGEGHANNQGLLSEFLGHLPARVSSP
jgi:hypothetical protein